ncbi:glucosaminidase domain-containing protein [Magnetospira sp. QH-2]|uniref:glucosaminidase domain-containing protein n=1 Tax=Magnetospira sp. (strain QH-2) TaxID=1288970 RepID=UPI0003E81A56|nr:glucosaminidase domain-containing protein [Magnetospira sp. QH-2]CCQ73272.1 putative GH73 : distantly related to peptidoglycan hydrolases [Magnetospira sp. QH-2]
MLRKLPLCLGVMVLLACKPVAAASDVLIEARNGTDVAKHMEGLGFLDVRKHPDLLKAVPRFRVPKVPETRVEDWSNDVQLRKSVFIRLGISAALQANEALVADRKRLLGLDLGRLSRADRGWLETLMTQYEVSGEPGSEALATLKVRVDAIPVSLAVVQAAIESGWLQSRFAREGQAVFGQWTEGERAIEAKESDARLAAFDSPHDSLKAYMRNLNTFPAYADFRAARAALRQAGQPLDGYALAEHLEPYAETGKEYVAQIRGMIERENLRPADTAVLIEGPRYIYRHVPEAAAPATAEAPAAAPAPPLRTGWRRYLPPWPWWSPSGHR